jgi:hypothetical protein
VSAAWASGDSKTACRTTQGHRCWIASLHPNVSNIFEQPTHIIDAPLTYTFSLVALYLMASFDVQSKQQARNSCTFPLPAQAPMRLDRQTPLPAQLQHSALALLLRCLDLATSAEGWVGKKHPSALGWTNSKLLHPGQRLPVLAWAVQRGSRMQALACKHRIWLLQLP